MDDNLERLIWIFAIAVFIFWLNRRADAKIKRNVELIEQAARIGGRYKQSIGNYAGRPLRWIKSATDEYQLCSDDAVLATLALGIGGRFAGGQTFENLWIAVYRHWWTSTCSIYQQKAHVPDATVEAGSGTESQMAAFADGQKFTFAGGKCLSGANQLLIGFVDRGVTLETAALQQPHLALLVLLGSAMMLQELDYPTGE